MGHDAPNRVRCPGVQAFQAASPFHRKLEGNCREILVDSIGWGGGEINRRVVFWGGSFGDGRGRAVPPPARFTLTTCNSNKPAPSCVHVDLSLTFRTNFPRRTFKTGTSSDWATEPRMNSHPFLVIPLCLAARPARRGGGRQCAADRRPPLLLRCPSYCPFHLPSAAVLLLLPLVLLVFAQVVEHVLPSGYGRSASA